MLEDCENRGNKGVNPFYECKEVSAMKLDNLKQMKCFSLIEALVNQENVTIFVVFTYAFSQLKISSVRLKCLIYCVLSKCDYYHS